MKTFYLKSRNCKNHKAGFTLIEILVVVGILALLASILFPALSRARENGKRTSCANNLKQIAVTLQQYAQDNDRRFPPLPAIPPATPDGSTGWAFTVSGMIRNDTIFQCPSESQGPDAGFTDYWMNAALLGKSDVRMRQPANIILNGEGDTNSVDYAIGAEDPVAPYDASYWAKWQPDATYTTRHLGGANYSFADGHVKFLKPDQIATTAAPDGSNFTLLIN